MSRFPDVKPCPAERHAGDYSGRYSLVHPPEFTAGMAAARWKDVNRLLHSLILLPADLRERRGLAHVLRSLRVLVGASRALLLVRDPASGECRVHAEMGFPREKRRPEPEARPLATAALLSRKPQLVAAPAEEELSAEIRHLGGGACLAVPIFPGGSPWGVVQLLRDEPFQEEDGILAWLYVMVLEEALPDLPGALRPSPLAEMPGEKPGLADPAAFRRRVEAELERAAWSGRPVSLVRVTWSSASGPHPRPMEFLPQAVRVIRRSLRPGVLMASPREREIFIALPGASLSEAVSLTRLIRRNLLQSRVLGEDRRAIEGLRLEAVTSPRDGRDWEGLLSAACRTEEDSAEGATF